MKFNEIQREFDQLPIVRATCKDLKSRMFRVICNNEVSAMTVEHRLHQLGFTIREPMIIALIQKVFEWLWDGEYPGP